MEIKKFAKTSLIFSIVYSVLFNSSILLIKYQYTAFSFFAFVDVLKDAILIITFCFLFFFGFHLNRFVFLVTSFLTFLLSAIGSYYAYAIKIAPSKKIIATVFMAENKDISDAVSVGLIFWVLFSISVWVFLIIKNKSFTQNTKILSSAICFFTSVLVTYNLVNPEFRLLKEFFPVGYTYNTYLHFAEKTQKQYRFDISTAHNFVDKSKDDLNVVLIIGESARYDHFGINGYERDTTPNVNKIKNLFSFKAKSAFASTCYSVSSMLSIRPKEEVEESFKETSVLSVFTKVGFDTSWIGNQTIYRCVKKMSVTSTFYEDVKFSFFGNNVISMRKLNGHDENMLPIVDKIKENSNVKKMIVIHTHGSHWNYDEKYPSSFKKFAPICIDDQATKYSTCERIKLINSYDNTILYTDYFISEVIERFKNLNTILIYVSDHGESLGEEGRFYHCNEDAPEQFDIPFFVWTSDKYIENNPDKFNAIKSKTNIEMSHDNIFHSLLDCASIESDKIDKNLSICNQN